ncbi:conserved Plasmodium protein, unknown function [Plasmodium relictum]|uniref:DNA polymerase delta subunit 3 n=1 Tax=Plasmodium relictum TaxID=85471 RepID=A0A1J1H6J4_PLARL|nr:conserved Plasmodium protein, unknown function [Plasmodium relictum]CRH00388.1 conserved Plasmodium protein, unknown function [Plasmodium relictum]
MNTQDVKNITNIEELLFFYDSLINDGYVITIVGVKNALKLPSDLSQKFMHYYFEHRKDQLAVTYLVEGYKKDNNEYVCSILNDKEVLEMQKEQNNYSIKIYSIQSNKNRVDLSILWKQELNELNKLFEKIDLKSQLLIPQFSDIILDDLKVKNREHNLDSQQSFFQNGKVKDDRKILIKEINHNENKDVNGVNKNMHIIEKNHREDRIDDRNIAMCIKKDPMEDKEDHNENEQIKTCSKNNNSEFINSFNTENINLNNDAKKFKHISNIFHKSKFDDDNTIKIKRENLIIDSENNEIDKSINEDNKKSINKLKRNKSKNEAVSKDISIKKAEKKIDEPNKNKIEKKLKQTKLEIVKNDSKSKLFQSDSSDDDTGNKDSEENEEPLKTFPKIKSIKETQMFYENGYLVTVDKDSYIHVDNPESNENESEKVIKGTTPSNTKKRKNLHQTLLTNFFKKKK